MDRNERDLSLFKVDARYKLVSHAINKVTVCLALFFLWKMIDSLAGKETVASFALKLFANQWFCWVMAILFGGGGLIYGETQRRFRKAVVKKISDRNAKLESKIDPARTSSGMTANGENPPGEEL